MSRSVALPEKISPTVVKKEKATKREFARSVNEHFLLTLGILSLCLLLLGLGIPLWVSIALGVILLLIQSVLYIQKRFFTGMSIDLELDADDVENAVKADLHMME